tara:strand:+ start:216 stop:563 length:348 start_codon:yes stop_codon:yes gene_type:complete
MSKKVRQTITIDVERLDKALVWHLNLEKSLRKLSKLGLIANSDKDDVLKLIRDCRALLASLDMTLAEFQEIYEALLNKDIEAPPTTPQLLKEETQNEIKEKFINNFMSNLNSPES